MEKLPVKSEKKEKFYDADTDFLRILAAFFVIMIHAAAAFTRESIFWNAVSRFSVPVFIMISGYYMLPRKVSAGNLLKKCLHMLVLMVTWSGVYFVYEINFEHRIFLDVPYLIAYLFTEPFHLWYLCTAITLYMFTPLLSPFCRQATRAQYLYVLILLFLAGSVVAILERADCLPLMADIVTNMKLASPLGFVFLYMVGGYFKRFPTRPWYSLILLYLLGMAGFIATFSGTIALSKPQHLNSLLFSFFSPTVVLYAIGIFAIAKAYFTIFPARRSLRANHIVHELANCTLGIYLLHPLPLMLGKHLVEVDFLFEETYGMIFLRCVILFLGCGLVILILRRIPLLRHLV